MSLPNSNNNTLRIGPTEPNSPFIVNRALDRLYENDVHLDKFNGKVAVTSADVTNIIDSDNSYLEDKFIGIGGINITSVESDGDTILKVSYNGLTVSNSFSGIVINGEVSANDIVIHDGSLGRFVRSDDISITEITNHIENTDNPHEDSLSGFSDVNINNVVYNSSQNVTLVYSNGQWQPFYY